MNDKPYKIINGTYYPADINNDSEEYYIGDHWRIWKDDSKYFLEYDEGHFSTKMMKLEITKQDYLDLRNGNNSINKFINERKEIKKHT